MMCEAFKIGIQEETIEQLFETQKISDYSLQNIKAQLGIKEPKMQRQRKTTVAKPEDK